ncbi:hypothetical protein ACROYT_G024184 [Oculina patagonica]
MAAAMEYSEEQLNYNRICYVTTDVLAEGLRTIFKQEWDNRFKTTLGEWKDEPRNGMDFYNGESPRNQRRNAHLLATMINGDRAEWDCTMLFYAILFSDCIHSLNPVVKSNVDNLRKFRNEEFAHMPKGHLSDPDFQLAIGKVHTAFQGLGLSSLKIQQISNQRSFPTEELRGVLKKVDDLKQSQEKEDLQEKGKEIEGKEKKLQEKEEQRQVLEDQLHNEISSFCILPPKPSHDVAERDCEVAEITKQLKQLKSANENSLSYLYISGNPGSGKSQLASLVAKQFYDEVQKIPFASSFVMTLNAESPATLLESYISFARYLKSPEYAVTNTISSKDLTTEEKITNLKTLISTKIEIYTSWLLVVDNVTSISRVHVNLPQSGRGQLLITTQDTTSIPLTSSSIQHISVSTGMDPRDARKLLAMLSGITDSEMEKQVAQALDHQPLALASAATYVRQVRQNKNTSDFGWSDYLEKLNKGQRGTTETILAETNPSYQKSMTAAITLAVEKAISSDKVIDHAFSFLSLCALQPLRQDIVINYITNVDKEIKDKELISMRIQRCSLLLFEEEESGVFIRVHQVVHNVINSLIEDRPMSQQLQSVNTAIRSFNQFIEDNSSVDWNDLDSFVNSKHIVSHLETLIIRIKNLLRKQALSQDAQSCVTNVQHYPRYFQKLGEMCQRHCAFDAAMTYFDHALESVQCSEDYNDEDMADAHFYIGDIHRDLGEFHQAREHFEYELSIRLKKLGPDHVDVATTYNNLGILHSDLGDLEQAKECYERVLTILLEKLGPDHVDVATTYNNLGTLHSDLDDLEQAKECYDRALTIGLEKLGPDHLDDLEQAKECYDRALTIRLEKLGPDHVDVATTYNNLGTLHSDLGDLEQAKECYDRALTIGLEKLGPDHVAVATTYNNLGVLHSDLGDLEQAKECYDRALTIGLEKLGPDHVDVATTYNNLGNLHRKLDDLEQAKECYDRALTVRLEKLGPDHVDVATTYNNLGTLHSDLGDLEQAKECYDRALTIGLEKLGPDHVDVATTYNNLGNLHRKLDDLEQAKECFERALTIRLEKLGPDHVDVAPTYNNLGVLHSDLGDLEQAKECYDRALTIGLEKLGPDHVDVATTYNNLGVLHSKLGDLEQAKECYDHALTIRLEKLGPDHVAVATTYSNLGALHSDLSDLQQAKECYDCALTIRLEKLGPDWV